MAETRYEETFKRLVKSGYRGNMDEEVEKIRKEGDQYTDDYLLYRVFDTCAYIEIFTSLENRAFFIEKMSNFLQSIVRNFA